VSLFEGGIETGFLRTGVMRKIFRPKKEEDRSWRKLHNDELHSLYSSPNIVRVIKSRRKVDRTCRMQGGRSVHSIKS
jgi:hypothetical protein